MPGYFGGTPTVYVNPFTTAIDQEPLANIFESVIANEVKTLLCHPKKSEKEL